MQVVRNPTLSRFERALASALLAGDLEFLATLRTQFDAARFDTHELSGAGFFLKFVVPESVLRVSPKNFELGDVCFEAKGLPAGGGAIMFVRDGVIMMLEAYSHDGGWPEDVTDFRLHYFDGEQRNMSAVSAAVTSPVRLHDQH